MEKGKNICDTLPKIQEAMMEIESGGEKWEKLKQLARIQMEKRLFEPMTLASAEAFMATIGEDDINEKKMNSKTYADANVNLYESMRILNSGNYEAIKSLFINERGLVQEEFLGGREFTKSAVMGTVQKKVSLMDYLNDIYGTSVSKDMIVQMPDGSEGNFLDAISDIFSEGMKMVVRESLNTLANACSSQAIKNNPFNKYNK